jgi:Na+-driven multidrug efflux pump
MAAMEGGILRGQGRQHLGGIVNLVVYWVIALPIGLVLAFQADWGLYGLWAGMVHSDLILHFTFLQLRNLNHFQSSSAES